MEKIDTAIGGKSSNTAIAVLLLSLSILLSACAQLFMKVSMLNLESHNDMSIGISTVFTITDDSSVLFWLISGLFCYTISMLSWLFALTRYELSFAYPFLGITYALVYLGAVYWDKIGEPLSWQRTTGIILILIGVVFVTYNKIDRNSDRGQSIQ